MEYAAQLGSCLRRLPGVQSVLALGCSASLVEELKSAGLQAEGHDWQAEALPSSPRTCDIALCLSPPNLTQEECAVVVATLARRSSRVLFSSESGTVGAEWLRAFLAAGYTPDLGFDAHWAGPGAVLLKAGAGGFDQASLLAEVLQLRSRFVNGNSREHLADQGSEARYRELESAVQSIRQLTADAREREETFLQRADSRWAQLFARTNQLNQTVQTLTQSRIWRTLAAAGGLVLSIGELGARLRRRLEPGTSEQRKTRTEEPIRVHCDEPDGEVLERMLRTGISGPLRVRGWAVSPHGIGRVELQVGDQAVAEARIGLNRPDLASLYPKFPGAGKGGFVGNVDTLALANGLHTLAIRAFDLRGAAAQLDIPVKVDHIHGYADDYHRWIQDFERREPAQIALRLQTFLRQPRISIIVPVYRTRPNILEKTIVSVLNQSYSDWELCIADDCSQSPDVDAILDRYSAADTRVKVVRLAENGGISAASNAALALATGEFTGLLDHDDELAQDALLHVVDALNREPDTDMIYSDEDHIDDEGLRSDPFFKPDWSPDLILGENYVCHFLVLRTAMCRELGGFRSETDLSQDMDIVLRASLKTQRILHIPRILYHWRTNVYTGDRASDAHRQRALETSRRVVEDYLKASGTQATVEPGEVPSRWRVRYPIPKGQSVRILVPCGGNIGLLRRCLAGLTEKTDFSAYQVSVIDNSHENGVADFLRNWSAARRKATYVDFRNQPFNFSAMNNRAARDAQEPLLLFLNDDISMIRADWLTAMVELASRPEVGAVGAKLLYPDNTIQHAGVVVGIFGIAGHGFKGALADDRTYFDFPHVIRNVSAVTGACMMVPTGKFRECGGFDEEAFPVSYNDVDLCLKLGRKGYRILYTPHAQLYHHEAVSKRSADKDPRPAETMVFKARWKSAIECDPFYSPNLTRNAEDYSYRRRMD
jgi:GT2 family glycosyltransferase